MLIATVEDVLRVCVSRDGIVPTFRCNTEDSFAALFSLQKAKLLDDDFNITPSGAEFIRRAEAGWPSEEVG
jgi:hypothetical protein